jgi:hypothetical protein
MNPDLVIIPIMFATVSFIVWVIVDGLRRRQQTKVFTEFHSKLLDRIGTAKEFGEFFSSDAGQQFLNSLSRSEAGAPQTRILRSMQTGLVLVTLGIAVFLLVTARSFSTEAVDAFVVIATAATAIGTALLISTAASYVLSKRMGLIERPPVNRKDNASV